MRRRIVVAILCAFIAGVVVGLCAFHPGDFNRDGRVTLLDFAQLQSYLLTHGR